VGRVVKERAGHSPAGRPSERPLPCRSVAAPVEQTARAVRAPSSTRRLVVLSGGCAAVEEGGCRRLLPRLPGRSTRPENWAALTAVRPPALTAGFDPGSHPGSVLRCHQGSTPSFRRLVAETPLREGAPSGPSLARYSPYCRHVAWLAVRPRHTNRSVANPKAFTLRRCCSAGANLPSACAFSPGLTEPFHRV